MNELLKMCLTVCPLVFLAGFIDAVAGGGGLISLPAFLVAGLPAHLAAGSNKFAMSLGTFTAAVKYMKSGAIRWPVALASALGAIAGAWAGVELALVISDKALKVLLLAALPCVAVFLAVNKGFGGKARPRNFGPAATAAISLGIGLCLGVYDGLIGPGTGTFLILAFSAILGIDLLTASGCAKASNLASNLAAVTLFAINGKVIYTLALPAAAFSILGNFLGARYAIKGGGGNVKKVMFLVLALLFVKAGLDLLGFKI